MVKRSTSNLVQRFGRAPSAQTCGATRRRSIRDLRSRKLDITRCPLAAAQAVAPRRGPRVRPPDRTRVKDNARLSSHSLQILCADVASPAPRHARRRMASGQSFPSVERSCVRIDDGFSAGYYRACPSSPKGPFAGYSAVFRLALGLCRPYTTACCRARSGRFREILPSSHPLSIGSFGPWQSTAAGSPWLKTCAVGGTDTRANDLQVVADNMVKSRCWRHQTTRRVANKDALLPRPRPAPPPLLTRSSRPIANGFEGSTRRDASTPGEDRLYHQGSSDRRPSCRNAQMRQGASNVTMRNIVDQHEACLGPVIGPSLSRMSV